MVKTPIRHAKGDRVYLVASEQLTGTVTDLAGSGPLQARVHWDNTPAGSGSWHLDADLECYTLPAEIESESDMERARR